MGSVGTPPCSSHPAGADCLAADCGCHTIGELLFLPDGTMLRRNGDGADAAFADTLALRAQDLNSTSGKLLRINKDGTAPPDNPFYDGTNSVRSKVWLYGVRNPFRFALQPGGTDVWFGDVGWNTWEEVDRGVKGANYGWPCYEGAVVSGAYSSYSQCANLQPSAVTMPFHAYTHASTGSSVIGGPFYRAPATRSSTGATTSSPTTRATSSSASSSTTTSTRSASNRSRRTCRRRCRSPRARTG